MLYILSLLFIILLKNNQDTIKLSSFQPFDVEEKNKKQAQYIRVIQPLIITDDLISPLPIESAEKGYAYIKLSEIEDKLKQIFITEVLPQVQHPLHTYNGEGITLEEINQVIINFEKEQTDRAYNLFKKRYKQFLNEGGIGKITQWLDDIKKTYPHTHPCLIKLANQYNEKHGIFQQFK